MIAENQPYAAALEALSQGLIVSHADLPSGTFIFRQVPSEVPASVIPRMSSLPDSVKAELIRRGGNIHYQNQWCIVHPSGTIEGWSERMGVLMSDQRWRIHYTEEPQSFPVAPVEETAGTGAPTERKEASRE